MRQSVAQDTPIFFCPNSPYGFTSYCAKPPLGDDGTASRKLENFISER